MQTCRNDHYGTKVSDPRGPQGVVIIDLDHLASLVVGQLGPMGEITTRAKASRDSGRHVRTRGCYIAKGDAGRRAEPCAPIALVNATLALEILGLQ